MATKLRKTTNFLVLDESKLTGALNALQTKPGASGSDPKIFEWNQKNLWRDRSSQHIVMIIDAGAAKMELAVHATGQWKLTGTVGLYVRQHEWVFKLGAYDAGDVLLFTAVTPRIIARPANDRLGNDADILVSGFSPDVFTHFGAIDHWIQRGSGRYWD